MLVSETSKSGIATLAPPRRGMSSLFFMSSSNKSLSSSQYSHSSSFAHTMTPSRTFSVSMVEENVENAEAIITKWDPSSSSYTKVTSIFQHSRKEAKEFLKAVKTLRSAMHVLLGEKFPSSKLVIAQNLMQLAMKRLENEFYQILIASRDHLDPESVSNRSSNRSSKHDNEEGEDHSSDELDVAGETITEVERASVLAMSDLKSIADCMISSGYGKECAKIYRVIRKSIVDEGLYHLGIQRLKSSHIHKMDSQVLDNEIKKWMKAAKISVKTLFQGEKILCDHVFSASETIKESCFYEITKEGAATLFSFPELLVKTKKVPERIFGLLELHEAVSDLWPETEAVFSSESTSGIKLQALSLLLKLGDSVRSILSDFESIVQKDSTKILVSGGGVHPLTQKVMNYLTSLADYSITLCDILADYSPPVNSSFHETFKSSTSDEGSTPVVSAHLAWLILVLLCKLDIKAEIYKDVGLAYLFLANNLHFIVEKVQKSHNLKLLLGEDWVAEHMKKVKLYASTYEITAWSKVLSSIPEKPIEMPTEMTKDCFRRFNIAFEEAYRKQTTWIVGDRKLRDDLKVSIAQKLVPTYQEFYETYPMTLTEEKNLETVVRFSPDDLGNYLSDLFQGTSTSVSPTASSSSPHRSCLPL